MKKIARMQFIVCLILVMVLTGVGNTGAIQAKAATESIKLNRKAITLYEKQSYTLKATVKAKLSSGISGKCKVTVKNEPDLSVSGVRIRLGDSSEDVISKLGKPKRQDGSHYGDIAYVYNSDYKHFIMVYLQEDTVVGYYTDDSAFAWYQSSGHRGNMLDKSFAYLGVGGAAGGTYGDYYTQNFYKK